MAGRPSSRGTKTHEIGLSVTSRLRAAIDYLNGASGTFGRLGLVVSRSDVEMAVNEAGREQIDAWLEGHGYRPSDSIDPLWVLQVASEVNLQRLMRAREAMTPSEIPVAATYLRR